MQIELGSIVEGKVTSITNFGAFIELPNNQTGLVHISEISSSFVKSVSDHLQEGQVVKVKVIDLGRNGKLGLSIKQAQPVTQSEPKKYEKKKSYNNQDRPRYPQGERNNNHNNTRPNRRKEVPEPKTPEQIEQEKFENMMSKFKKVSDENISTLKRNDRNKQRRPGNIR